MGDGVVRGKVAGGNGREDGGCQRSGDLLTRLVRRPPALPSAERRTRNHVHANRYSEEEPAVRGQKAHKDGI